MMRSFKEFLIETNRSLTRCTAVAANAILTHHGKTPITHEKDCPVYGIDVLGELKNRGLKWKPRTDILHNEYKDTKPITLQQFLKQGRSGTWYVSSANHAMAVVNGKLHDSAGKSGKRRLTGIYEITK